MMIRYIGKSGNGLSRPRSHRYPSNLRSKSHKVNWINQLISLGFSYEIVILEITTSIQLSEAECWWIAYGRLSDWPLVNGTLGGEGCLGRECTPETRKKIAGKQQGRPLSDSHKRALRTPKTLTEEQRQRISNRARAHMKVQAGKMLEKLWNTDNAKQLASERMKRLWSDPAYREHMSRAHTGHKHTDDHRRKIRESAPRGDDNPARRPEVRKRISEGLKASWERRRK